VKEETPVPFQELARSIRRQTPLRAAITAACRRPEEECLPPLLELAGEAGPETEALARRLAGAVREKQQGFGIDALILEFSLSSQEGIALMCLAEALLRIPDNETRDALIRDKIGGGDWHAHLGHSPSLFVNAAAWGLMITGRLVATSSEAGLSSALAQLAARGGEKLIRRGVDLAMRLLGEHFVAGQTIGEALDKSRRLEAAGFRHSYDMLGEAALSAADAERYAAAYREAIESIGRTASGCFLHERPGISVKLSALHPRFSRAQRQRVMAELLPRLQALAGLACRHGIGFSIDAEEADRLELTLDLVEALCFVPELARWDGIGVVVQAYQKRAPFVIEFLSDLARRSSRRLMVRLVKGAYWDSEIKRAQMEGLPSYPVFTRKVHTDVSYLACARKLLAAPELFPQFATHNAQTLAAIYHMARNMAGPDFEPGQYEFQCLHGMGEALYEEVTGPEKPDGKKLDRPCRIYAPVGTHETLLPYLVRRILENGANTSFVNRVGDASVPLDALVADPVASARLIQPLGSGHPQIKLPPFLFGAARINSRGLDLSDENSIAALAEALHAGSYRATPLLADGEREGVGRPILNPADHRDRVGKVVEADAHMADAALAQAGGTAPSSALLRAAELLEERRPHFLGILVREAGRSLPDAVNEVREAVDFLRYYGAANPIGAPLGPVACISPWNFPLSIFTGQVAAALAAGNPVVAKPAEETPLIAAAMVRLLHEAGVPRNALQLLPGDGTVGDRLVADPRCRGVLFTGSTEVSRAIQRRLAERLDEDGAPIPLIAETGGQNAMIVDSSALPEQVVQDVVVSAFNSAGQRCSALRILCLQEEIADRVIELLKGAMAELAIGLPDRLETDIGPVISAEAQATLATHVARFPKLFEVELPAACAHGSFVAPVLLEIKRPGDLTREVFGPVLHVLRYPSKGLDALIDGINALGFGLTFGLHSRIDETILHVTSRVRAGNLYVNRSMIGATVGVQPFGGHGLSGTGPKAGGPLYLRRLARMGDYPLVAAPDMPRLKLARDWCRFLTELGEVAAARQCEAYLTRSALGGRLELKGPVGEANSYELLPRGTVLCRAGTEAGLFHQIGAALATGNRPLAAVSADIRFRLPPIPEDFLSHTTDWTQAEFDAALFDGDEDALRRFLQALANRSGPIIGVQIARPDYAPDWLLKEVSLSINTAASGGNASLMSIG